MRNGGRGASRQLRGTVNPQSSLFFFFKLCWGRRPLEQTSSFLWRLICVLRCRSFVFLRLLNGLAATGPVEVGPAFVSQLDEPTLTPATPTRRPPATVW